MKKNFLLCLLAVASMVGFTACGGDTPEPGPGPGPGPDPDVEAITMIGKSGLGSYFINERTGGDYYVFQISMYSTQSQGSSHEPVQIEAPCEGLVITLCNNPVDQKNPIPPVGTYNIVPSETTLENTCLGGSYFKVDEEGTFLKTLKLASGTIEVALSGTNYTIKTNAVLEDGSTLNATFTGTIKFFDVPYSLLQKDHVMPLKDYTGTLAWRGKLFESYGINADVWTLTLLGKSKNENLFIVLCVPPGESTPTTGLPDASIFKVSSMYDDGDYMCAAGEIYRNGKGGLELNMSWFSGLLDTKVIQVPVGSGTMTVDKVGNSYTFKFNFTDDSLYLHKLTGEWTGEVTLTNGAASLPMRSLETVASFGIDPANMLSKAMQF